MRLKKTGVPDVKIRLYYQNNEAETVGPQCLNLCLSARLLYLWHCPNMGVPVFNWLCLSDLPPIIYYHTWSSFNCGEQFYQSFLKKKITSSLLNTKLVLSLQPRTLAVFPEDIHQNCSQVFVIFWDASQSSYGYLGSLVVF